MKLSVAFLFLAVCVVLSSALPSYASEDLIVIEQDYSIIEQGKGGFNAKDIRQKLYVTRDMVAIDEFGDKTNTPTETFLIDLKNQRIVDLDHTEKQILVNESFADRRAQILRKKKQVESDGKALETGPQKDRWNKLFGAMLDANRDFKMVDAPPTKELADLDCKTVKIVDDKDASFPPFTMVLHPDMDMPYDNSEVLFLLKIVGEKMAQYLKDNKSTFSRVPMEMHLELAEGGKLDSKVVSVKKMKLEEFDPKSRPLGNPFEFPEGYARVRKLTPKAVEPKKEKAD